MFSVDQVVEHKLPQIKQKPLLSKTLKSVLRYLLHEKEFVEFEQQYPYVKGTDFAETVLEYFDFGYCVSDKDRERIPATGRVVIVSNHPIGTLDGLALIKLVSEVRSDFKVVANDVLMNLKPLHPILIPVNNMGGSTPKKNLESIHQHLNDDGAIVIFPAGEVSRMSAAGVRDGDWHRGFLNFARATKSPILPIFVDARNSAFFYALSAVYKPLSTLFLVREMFKQANKRMNVKIGDPIPFEHYESINVPLRTKARLFKKHLYNLARGKELVLKTQKTIAHPEDRAQLRRAINACEHLGSTTDGKSIKLYRFEDCSPIMREIGRLRELSFRMVGEGTGKRRDIDSFDQDYLHLILWDENDLEIAGAYRFAETAKVLAKKGPDGIYTNTLFDYQPDMNACFEKGLELGRSFVQPKYWGKRSLDYLWVGIGAFLAKHPEYRYLFGPVSISNAMPQAAKNLMVHFYQMHFASDKLLAKAKIPYSFTEQAEAELAQAFTGESYQEDFTTMKHLMANMGVSVPTLYKQYSEVCEPEGVSFSAFNIDPDFADCIDGLVVVDLEKLKPKKRARYIDVHLPKAAEAA